MIANIVWALVIGVILGYLGKLLLPGRQDIPAWATIGAGVVAALLATVVARWLGVRDTPGIDWWYHVLQVVFAVVAIWGVSRLYTRRGGPGRTSVSH